MSKRSIVNDLYKSRKRVCTAPSSAINETSEFNDGLNGTSFSGNHLLLIWNVI